MVFLTWFFYPASIYLFKANNENTRIMSGICPVVLVYLLLTLNIFQTLFKANNDNTRKMCGICSKLTIKTTEQHQRFNFFFNWSGKRVNRQNYYLGIWKSKSTSQIHSLPGTVFNIPAIWQISQCQIHYYSLMTPRFFFLMFLNISCSIYIKNEDLSI